MRTPPNNLDGTLDITLGDAKLTASTGDFAQLPRGMVHAFRNVGSTIAGMLVFCAPTGREKYFEGVLEPVQDHSVTPSPVTQALIASLLAAGPKHGPEGEGHEPDTKCGTVSTSGRATVKSSIQKWAVLYKFGA
jgi:hypothetical protein